MRDHSEALRDAVLTGGRFSLMALGAVSLIQAVVSDVVRRSEFCSSVAQGEGSAEQASDDRGSTFKVRSTGRVLLDLNAGNERKAVAGDVNGWLDQAIGEGAETGRVFEGRNSNPADSQYGNAGDERFHDPILIGSAEESIA